MAGNDHLLSVRYKIEVFIADKIRELLEDPMNEFQDPNWVQAAILFEQSVVPCEEYRIDILYKLAEDIIEIATQNKNQAVYQEIPGMYNERLVDPNLIDTKNLPKDMRLMNYDKNIKKLKDWAEKFHET